MKGGVLVKKVCRDDHIKQLGMQTPCVYFCYMHIVKKRMPAGGCILNSFM